MDQDYKIQELIAKYLSNALSLKENNILNAWISKTDENKKLFNSIINKNNIEHYNVYIQNLDYKKGWQKIKSEINISANYANPKTNRLTLYISRVAAVLIIGILVSVLLIFNQNDAPKLIVKTIQPGDKKARLIKENGETIELNSIKDSVLKISGYNIKTTQGQLSYKSNINNSISSTKYNTLYIPKGGEYFVELSDGTKVWLNSVTKLKYPIKFIKESRTVILEEGEAYFEVAKDASRPFYVKLPNSNTIKVLGTQFNIRAYQDESTIITTLNEGSILYSSKNKKIKIKPNQQINYTKQNKNIQLSNVDASVYSAWKEGKFVFVNKSLEDIMIQLERWYDIKIFFMNDAIKKYHFTGDLKRYQKFEDLIKILELSTDVKFKIKGNSVLIRK